MRTTLVFTALLAALAGCGSQQAATGVASVTAVSAEPSASAGPTGTADPQEQGRKFAQCMREHGIPMEDPDPDGGGGFNAIGKGIGKKKIDEALDACRAVAPFKDRPAFKPEDVDKMREFAQCMRENGVDMPDPDPDGGFTSGTARNFTRDDPQFKKAFEVCSKKLPRMGAAK